MVAGATPYSGRARLTIAGEPEDRVLGPGDAVLLPIRCRHRVAWTDPDHPTVWLALFIDPKLKPSASGLEPWRRVMHEVLRNMGLHRLRDRDHDCLRPDPADSLAGAQTLTLVKPLAELNESP